MYALNYGVLGVNVCVLISTPALQNGVLCRLYSYIERSNITSSADLCHATSRAVPVTGALTVLASSINLARRWRAHHVIETASILHTRQPSRQRGSIKVLRQLASASCRGRRRLSAMCIWLHSRYSSPPQRVLLAWFLLIGDTW